MNNGSFATKYFMGRNLKRGIFCMLAAVLFMPTALLLKSVNENVTLVVLFLSMILELIGLVFVILSIVKRRREKTSKYDKASKTN